MSCVIALILIFWNTPTLFLRSPAPGILPQTRNTLCLIGRTGLPITVRFSDSIMLTQAIQQTGIARKSIKNEVWVVRRLETGVIQGAKIDLRVIEKRKTADYQLDQHDMVVVRGKKKELPAQMELIWAACRECGCRPMSGIEGPFIVPKQWVESVDPEVPDSNH